jgi:hypothetical protein
MGEGRFVASVVAAIAGGFIAGAITTGRAQSNEGPAGVPHYSVVESEAYNLVVADNQANRLFFYSVDKGQPVGSELKLRGDIDLKQVGQNVLKPTMSATKGTTGKGQSSKSNM